jgi:hypothetical protein
MGAAGMPVAVDGGMPVTPPTAADPEVCKVGPTTAELRTEYKVNTLPGSACPPITSTSS